LARRFAAALLGACRRVALGRHRCGGCGDRDGGDEFTFDPAAGLTREDVLKGLALIGQSIPEDQVAPA
jgi:hypothetical protein